MGVNRGRFKSSQIYQIRTIDAKTARLPRTFAWASRRRGGTLPCNGDGAFARHYVRSLLVVPERFGALRGILMLQVLDPPHYGARSWAWAYLVPRG